MTLTTQTADDEKAIRQRPLVPAVAAPRGKFWEVTYRSNGQPTKSWRLAKGSLSNDTGKTDVIVGTAKDGARGVNIDDKRFVGCDFNHFSLADSNIKNCTFSDCRFVKGNFTDVKFSGCSFEKCHFLHARFEKCQFLRCKFSGISASAELTQFHETSISAEAFTSALTTNVAALPSSVTAAYQQHRLLSSITKIARGIHLSVRHEPELDQMFDSNRCYEVALHRGRIANAIWMEDSGRLAKRSLAHRAVRWPLAVLTLGLIQCAGFFTDWGRSPLKTVWLLLATVVAFFVLYAAVFDVPARDGLLRALDCTFVFGYTNYGQPKRGATPLEFATFANAFLGFCWYALLIPALGKRIFR